MSVEVDARLKAIQGKLHQLLKLFNAVHRENTQLKKQLEASQQQIERQHEQLHALHQQVDVMKLGASKWSEEEKADLEKRIDLYLKEIDKCIALLNN